MEGRRDTQSVEPGVRDITEILPHIPEREPRNATRQQVLCELSLRVDRFVKHLDDLRFELRIPQVGLLRSHNVDHLEGELKMAALIAEHPVCPGRQAMQKP